MVSENRMNRIQMRRISDTPSDKRGFAALWGMASARTPQKLVTQLYLVSFFDLINFRPVLIRSLAHFHLQIFVLIGLHIHKCFAFLEDLKGLLPLYSIKKRGNLRRYPIFNLKAF